MNEHNTCCFVGHRTIEVTDALRNNLYDVIENLIVNEMVDTFLFGSRSQFDDLCYSIVTLLRDKHSHIKRVYVRAEFSDVYDWYTDSLLAHYEDTFFPDSVRGAGRASYVKRNQYMIDSSRYCVVYYNENYLPPRRKNSKRDFADYQPKSGTQIAYRYAMFRDRKVINVFCH